MATVDQSQDEDQEQGNSSGNSSGSSSPTSVASASPSTTESSTGASGGSKAPASSSSSYNPSAPTSSGNFTNLKSYLGANNNGQDFSNQVNTNLQNQGTALNNNIQGATSQFNNQVQSVVNPAQSNYQAYQTIANNNDPNAITSYANANTGNAQNIQNLENSTYTGPQTLNDLSGQYNGNALQSQVSNYQNLANDTTSDAGRMNLLQSLYGNSNYGQGQQTLDNVFLQGNNFGNTLSTANQVNNNYNQANNNASATAQNAQNTLGNIASGTQNSLNTAMSNEGNAIQSNYTNALAAQAAANTQLQTDLANNTLTQQEFNELGLTPGQSLYGVNPVSQNFIQNVALTPQNTASTQNYATIAALNSLLGNYANTQSSQLESQYAAPVQQVTNYQDTPSLAAAITAAQNQYNNQASNLVANANNSIGAVNSFWGENTTNGYNPLWDNQDVRRTDASGNGTLADINAQTNAANWANQVAQQTGDSTSNLSNYAAFYNQANSAIQQLAALQAQYGLFNGPTLQGAGQLAPSTINTGNS